MKRSFICIYILFSICCLMDSCRHRHYRDQVTDGDEVVDSRSNREDYREERRIRRGTTVKMEAEGGTTDRAVSSWKESEASFSASGVLQFYGGKQGKDA